MMQLQNIMNQENENYFNMKTSELKTIIKEEANDWTGKDLMDVAQALLLAKKSIYGAVRNMNNLEKIMAKHKNKPQGDILHSMVPLLKLSAQIDKIDKLDDAMGNVFTKAWDMLKKNE